MRIWHQSFSDLDLVPRYRATLREHANRVLPPGDTVELHGLRPGTYGRDFAPIHAIRHRYLEFLNEAQICEAALTAERAGYDAFPLGCFYDPAFRSALSLVDFLPSGGNLMAYDLATNPHLPFVLSDDEPWRCALTEEPVQDDLLKRRLPKLRLDPYFDSLIDTPQWAAA